MSVLVAPAALVRRDAEEGIARVLVGAVIDRDGQVLVLQRREGRMSTIVGGSCRRDWSSRAKT